MKTLPAIIAAGVVALASLGLVQSAASASTTSIRDGGYVDHGTPAIVVEFVVGDHGTRVTEDGITCSPNAALIAQGVTQGSEQFVPMPQPLPGRISAGGVITYSTTVTLTPADTQSNVSVTSSVVLTIHFLHLAKVVVNKTVVATGTVSVPNVCPGVGPTHFQLRWDPSARL